MRGKVIVREGETIEQALKRLRRMVCADREPDKWPRWLGCYARPSAKRHRNKWLKAMKRKWRRIWARGHRKGVHRPVVTADGRGPERTILK